MSSFNKWWICCAVALSCLLRFGSCRADRAPPPLPELFIFSEQCALKEEPGPCKAIKDRFFFDVNTGSCQHFEYGGCGGNANNFETLEQCEETCVVTVDKNPCHLPEAPGPCRGLVKRYFFHSGSQQCKHFFYGGCFGNANNFRSLAECQAKCLNAGKTTAAPEVRTQSARKATVQPTILTGELTVNEPQVQLNVSSQDKPEWCFSPVEVGTCDRTERRFAYNPSTKRCQMFTYSGCGGNKNNFKSRKHCVHKCKGTSI
ncbi:tissue factor pathway inhibitor a isoform X2 [Mugil cephalus]|uniref:tissue factor pathway inhibitor a isoform X2 n=1 Tax=Mugil cephalus TaxID=48193 RepID=UPI001FB7765E|nr:tissue factor pathway inhibitor a isoform X2 [Mugil cephalus]